MRPWIALLALSACAPVRLGSELADEGEDARDVDVDAAVVESLRALIALELDPRCGACATLTASASDGTPPYQFEWDDGSSASTRRICAPVSQEEVTVTVRDAAGRVSQPQRTRLTLGEEPCADASLPELLCVQNGSFEGTPAYNTGTPVQFDMPGWSDCNRDVSKINTPDVANDSIPQPIAEVPQPADGATFLGLMEGEQASQALCRNLVGGDTRSFRIAARRIDITAGVVPDIEQGFLELWGGIAGDCSLREVLWASPPLPTDRWMEFCIAVRPQQFTNFLSLTARGDGSSQRSIYLLVDNLVPVEACP